MKLATIVTILQVALCHADAFEGGLAGLMKKMQQWSPNKQVHKHQDTDPHLEVTRPTSEHLATKGLGWTALFQKMSQWTPRKGSQPHHAEVQTFAQKVSMPVTELQLEEKSEAKDVLSANTRENTKLQLEMKAFRAKHEDLSGRVREVWAERLSQKLADALNNSEVALERKNHELTLATDRIYEQKMSEDESGKKEADEEAAKPQEAAPEAEAAKAKEVKKGSLLARSSELKSHRQLAAGDLAAALQAEFKNLGKKNAENRRNGLKTLRSKLAQSQDDNAKLRSDMRALLGDVITRQGQTIVNQREGTNTVWSWLRGNVTTLQKSLQQADSAKADLQSKLAESEKELKDESEKMKVEEEKIKQADSAKADLQSKLAASEKERKDESKKMEEEEEIMKQAVIEKEKSNEISKDEEIRKLRQQVRSLSTSLQNQRRNSQNASVGINSTVGKKLAKSETDKNKLRKDLRVVLGEVVTNQGEKIKYLERRVEKLLWKGTNYAALKKEREKERRDSQAVIASLNATVRKLQANATALENSLLVVDNKLERSEVRQHDAEELALTEHNSMLEMKHEAMESKQERTRAEAALLQAPEQSEKLHQAQAKIQSLTEVNARLTKTYVDQLNALNAAKTQLRDDDHKARINLQMVESKMALLQTDDVEIEGVRLRLDKATELNGVLAAKLALAAKLKANYVKEVEVERKEEETLKSDNANWRAQAAELTEELRKSTAQAAELAEAAEMAGAFKAAQVNSSNDSMAKETELKKLEDNLVKLHAELNATLAAEASEKSQVATLRRSSAKQQDMLAAAAAKDEKLKALGEDLN